MLDRVTGMLIIFYNVLHILNVNYHGKHSVMSHAPFESHRCLNNLAVAFDTGELDTFKMFGINTAPEDRVSYRRVTTCAPLYLDDIRKVETVRNELLGTTEEVENIYAGPVKSGYSPLSASAPTFSRSYRAAPVGLGYSLEWVA